MSQHRSRRARWYGASVVGVAIGSLVVLAGVAVAAPQVSMSGTNPANNQTLTVSGTGFPSRSHDPTGVQIIECSDPSGSVANLPTTAANCDGATEDPLPVYVTPGGTFTTRYQFVALSGVHGTSNIVCDATHFCVLWIGIDYNNEFLNVHGFSQPFEIGAAQPASSFNVLVVVLPIVVILLVGTLVVLGRRRPISKAEHKERAAGRSNARA